MLQRRRVAAVDGKGKTRATIDSSWKIHTCHLLEAKEDGGNNFLKKTDVCLNSIAVDPTEIQLPQGHLWRINR